MSHPESVVRSASRGNFQLPLAFVCCAFVSLIPSGCGHGGSADTQTPQPPAVNVVSVRRGAIAHTLSLAGQFEPYQVVEVHAKVSGYIRKINVDIGDKVHAGQVLATLEVPELSAQLKGTVSEVAHSKDEIARSTKDVTRAESYHEALHANYVRLRDANAGQPGIIAQQELDDARSKDLTSEAQVEMAKSSLSASQQQSDVASADNQRVSALEAYTTVTAPLNGVILWRYADYRRADPGWHQLRHAVAAHRQAVAERPAPPAHSGAGERCTLRPHRRAGHGPCGCAEPLLHRHGGSLHPQHKPGDRAPCRPRSMYRTGTWPSLPACTRMCFSILNGRTTSSSFPNKPSSAVDRSRPFWW